ncbi:hypothetical protein APS_2644 [Acetobacter pasteurianus subsp. pasteurianus LMG 1262 = NBRC 106471]|nr:hypothetical protein APS_2644 [Acetobacter pasteurianus subsp. pasteurianus LMG 1262 = NBRC 106471]
MGTRFHWETAAYDNPHASEIRLLAPRIAMISIKAGSFMQKTLITLRELSKQIKDAMYAGKRNNYV